MTVIDKFHRWQDRTIDHKRPPYTACSPFLRDVWLPFLLQLGGESVGCHYVRPPRGGSSRAGLSTHSWGAALDWNYGTVNAVDESVVIDLMEDTIEISGELGIQAIHDYKRARIWRPPGHSGRPADGDGWKPQPIRGAMGQPWATWLHFEVHPDGFSDTTRIQDRLVVQDPPPQVAYDPEMGYLWKHTEHDLVVHVTPSSVRRVDGPEFRSLSTELPMIESSDDLQFETYLDLAGLYLQDKDGPAGELYRLKL